MSPRFLRLAPLLCLALALGCGEASPVTVYLVLPSGEGGAGGDGGTTSTASGIGGGGASATNSTSGQGGNGGAGEGGNGGQGGSGGAPCEPSPVDCAALPPGQCGAIPDGCGGLVDCGTLSGACSPSSLWCNLDANACGCPVFAAGDTPPDCAAFPGYEPRKCGDVASEDTPPSCFATSGIKLGFVVWCCPAG